MKLLGGEELYSLVSRSPAIGKPGNEAIVTSSDPPHRNRKQRPGRSDDSH